MADDSLDIIYKILTDLTGLRQGVQDVTKHTEQIEKEMQGMLSAVKTVGSALGIAFSVGAVVQFGKSILNDADALTKMSDQTGIGVEALQRLRGAANESGNSLDEITAAITFMQKKLAGGDDSVTNALGKLHLDLKTLRELNPDQQFVAIAKAVAAIPDPLQRAQVASAIFGRQWATIMPTLLSNLDEIMKGVTVMSDGTVKKLDQAGDAWGRWWQTIKNVSAEAIVYLADLPNQIGFAAAEERARDELAQLIKLRDEMIRKTMSGGSPGLPTPIGMPAVPDERAQDALRRAAEAHLKATIEADKHAEAVKKADAEYRQLGNWIEEQRLNFLGKQIQQAADEQEQFNQVIRAGGTQLELYGTDIPQMFMGLANGVHQVLEPTRSWRDTLSAVTANLSVVGDRWSSVAVGMIRNLESVVALWQTGFKAQAIGQTIGALGQLIPESDRASVSAAKMATQFAAVGSVFGPWGTAIGAGVGAIYGWIKAGQDARKANDLRDAFQATFGSVEKMDAALRKVGMTAREVFNARSVAEFKAEVEEFNRRLDVQKQAYDDLMDAVQRYGFSTEQLGPILGRQKLSEQLQQIYKDWQLLTAAQIDSNEVAEHMADSVNDLLHQYTKLGLEVPLELKPILQKLIDMGLLVDENGDKITDLKDIKFSETMSQGFDRVANAIKEMTDLLKGFLGVVKDSADQVRNFPTFPDVQVPGIPPPGGGPELPQPPDQMASIFRGAGLSDAVLRSLVRDLPDMMQRAVMTGIAVAGA